MGKMSSVLDKHGDLNLKVGERQVWFKVCSRALARASPVFERMLYGDYDESKPSTGPWTVRLPDEEPIAFRILLAVFHARTNEVPENLPNHAKSVNMSKHRLLHDLAVIADKYFLMENLRPWVKLWLKPWREEFLGNFDGKWLGEIITAAWLFGDQELLQVQLDNVVASSRLDVIDDVLGNCAQDMDGVSWALGVIPEGPAQVLDNTQLSGLVQDTRAKMIRSVLDYDSSMYLDLNHDNPADSVLERIFISSARHANNGGDSTHAFRPWVKEDVNLYQGTLHELFVWIQRFQNFLWAEIGRVQPPSLLREVLKCHSRLHNINRRKLRDLYQSQLRPWVDLGAERKATLDCRGRKCGLISGDNP